MDILAIIDALEQLFTGKIFLHHNNVFCTFFSSNYQQDYYQLHLHAPNFNWKYEPQPLPPHGKLTTYNQVKPFKP
jgi:hypothetical protein